MKGIKNNIKVETNTWAWRGVAKQQMQWVDQVEATPKGTRAPQGRAVWQT